MSAGVVVGNADLLASENLINCFLREGGEAEVERAGVLRIPLRKQTKNIYVKYQRRLLLGDVRLSEAVCLEGTPLHAAELADILSHEIGGDCEMPKGRESDWRPNFLNSLQTSEMILTQASLPSRSALTFSASEQSLVCGHRFHPSPKSRVGFSESDLREYSPEFETSIRLHYFAMQRDKNYVSGEPEFIERWQYLSALFNLKFGEIAIPVHPWQAQMALKDPGFADAVRGGRIRDLGVCGPEFIVTSSVRTLYQPDWDIFIKTSLAVRVTNCFRLNLIGELKAIRIINSHLDQVTSLRGTCVRILREPLGLDVGFESAVKLGTLFREGLGADRDALLTAALFGDRDFGLQRVQALGIRSEQALEWFNLYCQRLVPPLVDLFWKDGVFVEPHLQNVLVVIENGLPKRFLVRDLDNARLVAGLNCAAEALPDMVYSAAKAWKRFTYTLIVNHLAEVAATLSELGPVAGRSARELELWKTLRACLADCVFPEPFKHELLNGPSLFAKKNFFTRVTRCNDSDAPFAEIPNPMAFG